MVKNMVSDYSTNNIPLEDKNITYQHNAIIETENRLRERLRQKFGDKIKIKDDSMNNTIL